MTEAIHMLSGIVILNNSLYDYAISLAIIVIGLPVISGLKKIILAYLTSLVNKTTTFIDDEVVVLLKSDLSPLLYAMNIYAAIIRLTLVGTAEKIINTLMVFVIIIFSVKFLQSLAIIIFNHYWELKQDGEGRKSIGVAIKSFIRIILWITALLIFLDNIGVKISGIIAGLGIGGIVIAFAAQALLSDFFSYFSIFLDRPFEIGDFIMIDTYLGTIDHIGIKTTRIRSLSGEELIFPNTDMTSSRIRNFKRMEKRRVNFSFGVTYDTKLKLVQKIPSMVKKIIDSIEGIEFDRAHFTDFADSSLLFEVVYYISGSDYSVYRDIQQKINLDLMAAFEKQKIEFAFPTRTVYVKK